MNFVRKHRGLMVIALFAVIATCCADQCSDFNDAVSDLLSDGYPLEVAVIFAGLKIVAQAHLRMCSSSHVPAEHKARQSDQYEPERQYRSRRRWREVQRYS